MNRILVAILLSACAACAPPLVAELQPLDVEVMIVGSATVSFDALRVAVRFESLKGDIEMGSDIAITSTGAPYLLRIEAPSLTTAPASDLRLALDGTRDELHLAWPRLIAYLDHDHSGDFDPSIDSPDQVLGTDSPQNRIGWLVDPEDALSRLSPEATESYYQATGGLYTPFLVYPLPQTTDLLPVARLAIPIDASRLSIANSDLRCRGLLRNGPELEPEIKLWVDRSLDPAIVCGLDIADCRPVDTSTLTAPELPPQTRINPVVSRTAQCRRRLGVELLVLQEQRIRCDGRCICAEAVKIEAVATSTSAEPPSWWPCGQELPYCDSSLPLYRVDPKCLQEDE